MADKLPFAASLNLDESRLHLLLRALDTYVGVVYLRAQEARLTDGQMLTHLNEGLPPEGLDEDRLRQLNRNAERLIDELLDLIPSDSRMTAVYEDGTPAFDVVSGSGEGPPVLIPASIANNLSHVGA